MSTGEKIQELRRKKKITQEQLADMLNVSRQSVSKWELDNAYPETDKIIKIAEIFEVSIDYLLKENYESEEQFKEKNNVNTFNMVEIIVISIITFGYVLGIILSYIFIKKEYAPLIGFTTYFVISFSALILYIVFRARYLTKSSFSKNDKLVIFSNTRLTYYFLIISFLAIIPIVIIKPVYLSYDIWIVGTTISFGSYMIFGTVFSLIGFLISECVENIHYKKVYNQKYEISFFFLFIDTVFMVLITALGMYLIIINPLDFIISNLSILGAIGLLFFNLLLPIYLYKNKICSKKTFNNLIISFFLMIIAYIFNHSYDFFAILIPLLVLIYALAIMIKPVITGVKDKSGNAILAYKNIILFSVIVILIEVFIWTTSTFEDLFSSIIILLLVSVIFLALINITINHNFKVKTYSSNS